MIEQKKKVKKESFSISIDPVLFGEVLKKADELAIKNQTSRSTELCNGLYSHFKVRTTKATTQTYNCSRAKV